MYPDLVVWTDLRLFHFYTSNNYLRNVSIRACFTRVLLFLFIMDSDFQKDFYLYFSLKLT